MRTLMRISTAVLLCIGAASAAAQGYPERPIRMVVPFPAGGGTDSLSRLLATALTSKLNWVITVDNKPGAGGNLALDTVAKAKPDGYTLVMAQTDNVVLNPLLYSKMTYDPVKDLEAVSSVASGAVVLVVRADSPYKTLADVIAAGKAKPDAINYASSGSGTVAHLAVEQFQKVAGVKFTHVPYKGAAQGATDLIGGQIQLYMSSVPTLIGHIRSGKMRAIAVTSDKRVNDLPNVPTIAESGFKGFEAVTWFGIAGPASMPKDAVTKLNVAFNKALQDADVRKKLEGQGADVLGGTPEQFGKLIQDDIVRWGKVVKDAGAKVD